MATVHDVAKYVLERSHGPMTAMKLQKLVYYAQAWSTVWDDQPLFSERIEAWANGPVAPDLYREHRGQFMVEAWPKGASDSLGSMERETIDAVLRCYGGRTSRWLSDLTHSEPPWRDARRGIPDGQPGSREITHAAMAEYYGSLNEENAESLG